MRKKRDHGCQNKQTNMHGIKVRRDGSLIGTNWADNEHSPAAALNEPISPRHGMVTSKIYHTS
jgi:hypothetical protein